MDKLLILKQKNSIFDQYLKFLIRFYNNFCIVYENSNNIICENSFLKNKQNNNIFKIYKRNLFKHKFKKNLYINKVVKKQILSNVKLNLFLNKMKNNKYNYIFNNIISSFGGFIIVINNNSILLDKKSVQYFIFERYDFNQLIYLPFMNFFINIYKKKFEKDFIISNDTFLIEYLEDENEHD